MSVRNVSILIAMAWLISIGMAATVFATVLEKPVVCVNAVYPPWFDAGIVLSQVFLTDITLVGIYGYVVEGLRSQSSCTSIDRKYM